MTQNRTLESINDGVKATVVTKNVIIASGSQKTMKSELKNLLATKADLLKAKDDLTDNIAMLPDTETTLE